MKEVRFFYVPDAANCTELPEEEATHALRVLRLKAGDEMMLMDGKGNYYRAEVTLAHTHHCCYAIKDVLPQERQWKGRVHLAIAPTKMMDRIEWMVEKAVEIGVDELSFLDCQFSERRIVKLPRIEKIVISAVKQSRKAWKPLVNELQSFKNFVEQPRKGLKFICHCYNEIERKDLYELLRDGGSEGRDITVLVGPEGDFSVEEVRLAMQHGYESVSLGRQRLRTETAALSAVMTMQLCNR
jgi:16S rRNA (uracil1498-N3)-methyltransferase